MGSSTNYTPEVSHSPFGMAFFLCRAVKLPGSKYFMTIIFKYFLFSPRSKLEMMQFDEVFFDGLVQPSTGFSVEDLT